MCPFPVHGLKTLSQRDLQFDRDSQRQILKKYGLMSVDMSKMFWLNRRPVVTGSTPFLFYSFPLIYMEVSSWNFPHNQYFIYYFFLKIQKKFLQDSYMYIRTEYLFVAVGLKYMLNQNWNVTCKVKSEVKNIYSCEIIYITFIVQNLGPRTSYWQAQWGAW